MDEANTPRRRPRRRPQLYIIGGAIISLILLVILLPTLISWGLGQGIIADRISDNINGRVTFSDLQMSWIGDQNIRNLTVSDRGGNQAAKLDVRLAAGLLNVVFGGVDRYDITLSGSLNGEIREDGSISFADLVAKDTAPARPSPQPPGPAQPFKMPEIPALNVQLNSLNVTLADRRSNQTLELQDLNGKLTYIDSSQPMTADIRGATRADGVPGTFEFSAMGDGLFDANGELQLREAMANVTLKAQSLPLIFHEMGPTGIHAPDSLQNLEFKISSDDLTKRIALELWAQGGPGAGGSGSGVEAGGAAGSADAGPTSLRLQATLGSVLSGRGELSLRNATAHIDLAVQNVAVSTGDVQGTLRNGTLTINSDDLTGPLILAISGEAQLQGHEPSSLTGNLTIDQMLGPQGEVAFSVDKITGQLRGQRVPTPVLQPLLAATPIQAGRDIGPLLDVDATFSAGQQREVAVAIVGDRLRLEVRGRVDPATLAFAGSSFVLHAPQAHPDLLTGFAGGLTIDRPLDVEVELNSFTVPPAGASGEPFPLHEIAAAGRLSFSGPAAITLPAGGSDPDAAMHTIAMQSIALSLHSQRLGNQLDVSGTILAEDATINLDYKISKLFDESGALAPAQSQPVGTLTVIQAPSAAVARFAPAEQSDLIRAILGESFNVSLTTTQAATGLQAHLQASGQLLTTQVDIERRATALAVMGGHVSLQLTPELAALLQRQSPNPAVLDSPAIVVVDLQNFEMPRTGDFAYDMPIHEPIRASVEVQQLTLAQAPGLIEPVGFDQLFMEVQRMVEGSAIAYSAVGDVVVRRVRAGDVAAAGRFNGKVSQRGSDVIIDTRIGLARVHVPHLEQMTGQPAGALSQWTGDVGSVSVGINATASTAENAGPMTGVVKLQTQLPLLASHFEAISDGQMLTITGEAPRLTLAKATLEQRLNPPVGEAAGPDESVQENRVRVEADVPLTLKINALRLPMGLVQQAAFDPKSVDINVAINGGPLHMINPGAVQTSLSQIIATATTQDLAQGLHFGLRGTAGVTAPETADGQNAQAGSAPRLAEAGELDVTGTLADLIGEDATLSFAKPRLQMTANARRVPTAVADVLANMNGLLVAAVGAQMNAKIKADDFSTSSGALDVRIDTSNGFLESTVRGREDSLRITKSGPLLAELALTPALRERLLEPIHPILGDIRTTEQPVRATVTNVAVPFTRGDGGINIAKLKADIEITIGKVAFDSGSTTLKLLTFFNQQDRSTIPGEVEPIIAAIRDGIVTYEKFAVRIDKYTLNYLGQIDLVKQEIDLRTEIPLEALAHTFKELEGYADKIVVPIVTRGSFAAYETKIDPEFDLTKAAVKAGVGGSLEKIIKDKGAGVLEDLLKKGLK